MLRPMQLKQTAVIVACLVASIGLFSVATADVRKRDRSFYARLLSQFIAGSSTEAGHFIERLWPFVFRSATNGPHTVPRSADGQQEDARVVDALRSERVRRAVRRAQANFVEGARAGARGK